MLRHCTMLLFLASLPFCATGPCLGIEVTSSGDPADDLADVIIDQTSGIGLVPGSADTTVVIPEGGTTESVFTARGTFVDGITAAGTALPAENQNPNGPTAVYAGGIGIDTGICLSTGWITDVSPPSVGRGFGVEGPNNGDASDGGLPQNHDGETSTRFARPRDLDLINFAFPMANPKPLGGDANVLQFDVEITSPGFLRLSFVFASDEYPAWTNPDLFPFNDAFIILVDETNIATITRNSTVLPFNLFDASTCGPLFLQNNTAPWPAILQSAGNLHKLPGSPHYDHEYGGFTKVLTREAPVPLSPGIHTIKIAIQDVGETSAGGDDFRVDSCLFIGEQSLKLYSLRQGDYNGNGIVDAADYVVWQYNYQAGTSPADFYDGDGNGNGVVDTGDYDLWYANFGLTGNRDWKADFDRSGCVGTNDLLIMSPYVDQLDECASRFEGDATGDGAVDFSDIAVLSQEFSQSCDGGSAMMAGAANCSPSWKQC